MRKGKVYLVGAGPGDPGLLTLKGFQCLTEAEVIIYDRLVNPRFLEFASETAEIIYAGKSPRAKVLTQIQINQLMARKARGGKRVLRLKGGDAFLFSRGAEEALFLAKHRIPFEVVPGISSVIAAPAYAGIPLTHRDYTSSVGIFTGHEDPSRKESAIDWQKISTGLGTLVFLMGVSNLSSIVEKLIRFGRPKNSPCSLIQWGTLPEQKTVTATLKTLPKIAKQARISNPAILVVGEVVKLRKDLNWFETRPLFGKKILVTCHKQGLEKLSSALEEQGAMVAQLPLIRAAALNSYKQLDSAINRISDFDWLVFSSQNGVQYFIQRLNHLGRGIEVLCGTKLATIGPNTRMALERFGLSADIQAEEYCQEGLLESLKKRAKLEGRGKKKESFLLVCSGGARNVLADGLRKMGAGVEVAVAYKTVPIRYQSKALNKILTGIDLITFSSSSSVRNFFKVIPRRLLKPMLNRALVVSIGPVTSKEARSQGLKVDIEAKQYSIEGMVETIVRHCRNDKRN